MSVTTPPIPSDDSARLSTLSRYPALEASPGIELANVAQLAAEVCRTAVAAAWLVDEQNRGFEAVFGIEGTLLSAARGFGDLVNRRPEAVAVVPDASADARLAARSSARMAPG